MSDQMTMARRMINASICAYQIYETGVVPTRNHKVSRQIKSASGKYFYDVVPFYQDAVGFPSAADGYAPQIDAAGDDLIDAALVGLTEDGYAVVAIRGTLPPSFHNNDILEWMTDWRDDADMDPIAWRPMTREFGKVEHGFAKAALALWPIVDQGLKGVLDKAPKGVVVTGHSKGGSVTYLIASLIREKFPELAGRIQVHAFAPAVAVDEGFLKVYKAQGLDARTHRYQVARDMVPFVPLWKHVNVWSKVFWASHDHKLAWGALAATIFALTRGGYKAPGSFTYFDETHAQVPGAVVTKSALPTVVEAVTAGDYAKIGAAHSATQSYLPCFCPSDVDLADTSGVQQS